MTRNHALGLAGGAWSGGVRAQGPLCFSVGPPDAFRIPGPCTSRWGRNNTGTGEPAPVLKVSSFVAHFYLVDGRGWPSVADPSRRTVARSFRHEWVQARLRCRCGSTNVAPPFSHSGRYYWCTGRARGPAASALRRCGRDQRRWAGRAPWLCARRSAWSSLACPGGHRSGSGPAESEAPGRG